MKNSFNTNSLTNNEMLLINGGETTRQTFPYDGVIWVYVGIAIWEFAKAAAEYQASLPPNLKK